MKTNLKKPWECFTFVCENSDDEWTGKQYKADLDALTSSTFDLERKLVQVALSNESLVGFSLPSPMFLPLQLFFSGGAVLGGRATAEAPSGGAAAAEAPAAEEKKPEKKESEDEDMGFSLLD